MSGQYWFPKIKRENRTHRESIILQIVEWRGKWIIIYISLYYWMAIDIFKFCTSNLREDFTSIWNFAQDVAKHRQDMVAITMKKPEENPTSIKINSKILFESCQDYTGKWEYWFQEGLVQYDAVRTDQADRNL